MLNELAEDVVLKLYSKGLKIATAESCTGGMLAQYITSVNGSSNVFECGIVSYANRIKEQELFVSHESLQKYGAVSEQVCIEMAKGIMKKAEADIGVAITGIAGPTGGTSEKPVGTVHIVVYAQDKVNHKLLKLSGGRKDIREQTTKQVLNLVKEIIDTLSQKEV